MYGIALDMSLQGVSAALLSSGSVPPGSVARGTGRVADVCVGRELLGRVIDLSAVPWTVCLWMPMPSVRWRWLLPPLWTALRWIPLWRPVFWRWTA